MNQNQIGGKKLKEKLDWMTKLIVDSNIIFSAILNVNSRIGQILLTSEDFYDFYAPKYLRNEIWEHQEKIKEIGNLTRMNFLKFMN